jgi:hypothetical protein
VPRLLLHHRPNPSSVFFVHRPFTVAVTVHGAAVEYVYPVDAPVAAVLNEGRP